MHMEIVTMRSLILFICLCRMSVVEKADWKNLIDLVTNAKQVVSSVQDVARKLADYANFKSKKESSGKCSAHNLVVAPNYKLYVLLL